MMLRMVRRAVPVAGDDVDPGVFFAVPAAVVAAAGGQVRQEEGR